jgi:rare lipoprotein A
MRKITSAGAASRLMMVVFGATLATSAIGFDRAQAAQKPYQINGKWYSPHGAGGYDQSGTASYYGPGFHGRKTANGETYDQWGMTAAHPTLPMGTQVYVTNQKTGKTVKVRINDRGPYAGNRLIDLSTHVAQTLGISGLGQVRVRNASLGAPSDEKKSEKRVIASKAKDDDKPTKAKVKVAALSEPETKAKPKAPAASTQKAEVKDEPKPKATPARIQERPYLRKQEVSPRAGESEAASLGGDPANGRLIRQLETVAVAQVQAEWRKALSQARKA